ncbi:hypothetical protein B808_537 [Fructilactobacillus florum 8D]|uniref:DUF4097 domain-containing protein n=2 Tax=Fructilactobacillus florum TaxID=640331 RepID=W9ELD7_9LACO|nr:DUF4097 family beta strand repeat-containing protein [Fructilactobacillus florum]ETO40484.1 hypothetical protein B808_537 [Fructilactobacillus florum 8D]KRM91332.1 hypothetical protein FC87_GL001053 [Fructilactobacillus florum DSM 22689 = JCM 16035]
MKKHGICSKAGLVAIGVGLFMLLTFGQSSSASAKTTQQSVASFNKVKVNLVSNDLKITTGDHFSVKTTNDKRLKPRIEVKDGTLQIKASKKQAQANQHNKWATVEITLPKGQQLENLEYQNVNGDLYVDQQEIDKANLESNTGSVKIKRSTINQGSTVSLDNGGLTITKGRLEGGVFNLKNGNLQMHNVSQRGTTKISNKNGDNEVIGANRKSGYALKTNNGTNKLFKKTTDDHQLTQKSKNSNQLSLTNENGDNTIKE